MTPESPKETVIGKCYMVPCVYAAGWKRPMWVPIMGPLHSDKEIIKFVEEHWHIDWRFAPNRLTNLFKGRGFPLIAVPISLKNAPGGMAIRRMKCLREMPVFPSGPTRWLDELQRAFAGKRMSNMICPHQGLPLHGCPVRDGAVICSGHGLAWDIKTGELVDRLAPNPKSKIP